MDVDIKTHRIEATQRSGKQISIPFWVIDSRKGGPCLLLTAAQHGNEVQGSEAIRRFVELTSKDMIAGKVIAVPFANLPAVWERRPHIRMRPEQAYGDDRGHNMNRTWPGSLSGNDTARVSHAIYQAVGEEATHLLDLHCWTATSAPAVLVRDAPEMRELAQKLGHRFVQVRPPSEKTVSGYFCSTGRMGITYEFAGQYLVDETQMQRGMRIIINMARVIGLLSGKLIEGDDPVLFSDRMQSVDIKAPCSGLFVGQRHELCDPVKEGDVLGHILSDVDLSCHTIVSTATGYLSAFGASRPNCDVALPSQHPYVSEGDRLARVAWPANG
jgi:predicted deacylase